MIFDWDPRKSDQNFARRGFDFEFATLVFTGRTVEFDDTRRDYGERRVIAIGHADRIPLTVVYTDRIAPDGQVVRRIISARVSHRKERLRHAQALAAIAPPDDADQGAR
ncbi:MAG: BrnT family toxin [Gemmatimonadetes bacterium]|nr:BrnT family toxin [Gemmatimonadota bacterium]